MTSSPQSKLPLRPEPAQINDGQFTDANTYLHELCKNNAPLHLIREAVETLGADVNARNKNHISPLGFAVQAAACETVEYLLSRRAEIFYAAVSVKGEPENFNAVFIAALRGDYGTLNAVLNAGGEAHVNKTGLDPYGNAERLTPLMAAARRGHAAFIPRLATAGADINAAQADSLQTPLHFAALHKDSATAANLLLRGAAVNPADKEGKTPLHIAAYFDNPKTVSTLAGFGGAIEARDHKGRTPLFLAAENKSPEAVAVLLQKGAHPDARGGEKPHLTPLMLAAQSGSIDIAKALVAGGADVLLTDDFNRTAARHATDSTNHTMAESKGGTRKKQPATLLQEAEDRAFCAFYEKNYRRFRPG